MQASTQRSGTVELSERLWIIGLNVAAMVALVLAFAFVLSLIANLDRPQEGLLRVSQQAMIDVQKSMETPQP